MLTPDGCSAVLRFAAGLVAGAAVTLAAIAATCWRVMGDTDLQLDTAGLADALGLWADDGCHSYN